MLPDRTDAGASEVAVKPASSVSQADSDTEFSSRPFANAAPLWRAKGLSGTIPLPARQKNPPPTGWTGRNAEFPSNEQVSEWEGDPHYAEGNLAQHLGFPVPISDGQRDVNGNITPAGEYETMGIDVDHYRDGGKDKRGGDQLAELGERLGPLSPTYVSTARAEGGDFRSGIRLYLVQRGLAFRGQLAKDIEIICKSHRYAVVWPSYNPKTKTTYQLYSPTEWANHLPATNSIPDVTTIPRLDGPWVDYATNGGMLDAAQGIDMDSTPSEVDDWAARTFRDGDEMCTQVRQALNRWTARILGEATSHDKIVHAHWNLYSLAAEGHIGWQAAVAQINDVWIADVIAREKRGASDLRGEIFRSRMNALRKLKAQNGSQHLARAMHTCVKSLGFNRRSSFGYRPPGSFEYQPGRRPAYQRGRGAR